MEEGKALVQANTKTVTGSPGQIPNFYKKPNGVFYIAGKAAGVLATEAFLSVASPTARFATQSGPMLVIDGDIHPGLHRRLDRLEAARRRRSGEPDRRSSSRSARARVNFYDFARFFRDQLGCQNALFLDGGSAPGLFAPELDRDDAPGHGGYGPIVAVVK